MEYTKITGTNMEYLKQYRTPEEILDFMKNGALFRSFRDVLEAAAPGRIQSGAIARKLAAATGENEESTGRKVRNWLNGRNMPKTREEVFQLCFVLGLDEEAADKVLGFASDTGIHYRNPKELVYAYALRKKQGYREAQALKEQVYQRFFQPGWERNVCSEQKGTVIYTTMLRKAFEQVYTDEELMDFFDENAEKLGLIHETAYKVFMDMLQKLIQPESILMTEEKEYSMSAVMEQYFRMHVPEGRRLDNYTVLQKMIKQCWPNETSLANMKNKKEDVSRKTIILLYLITEAFEEASADDSVFDPMEELAGIEEPDGNAVMENRLASMQLFLNQYGMNQLDAGNPFDYLAIYAMQTQDGDYSSDKLDAVLALLYD